MVNKKILSVFIVLLVFIISMSSCTKVEEKELTPEDLEKEIIDTWVLDIKSIPSSAQVYLNNELKGITPLILYNIPVGTYDLVIKKEGYNDFKKTVNVKLGRTEEINEELTQEEKIVETIQDIEKLLENESLTKEGINKINLSTFAMYYDFDKIEFTEIRTEGSDLFSRKYENYVHFTALVPAKINAINKPINEVIKEDCIFVDTAVAQLFSGQTLCVKTGAGKVVVVGSIWQTMPTELEWLLFD